MSAKWNVSGSRAPGPRSTTTRAVVDDVLPKASPTHARVRTSSSTKVSSGVSSRFSRRNPRAQASRARPADSRLPQRRRSPPFDASGRPIDEGSCRCQFQSSITYHPPGRRRGNRVSNEARARRVGARRRRSRGRWARRRTRRRRSRRSACDHPGRRRRRAARVPSSDAPVNELVERRDAARRARSRRASRLGDERDQRRAPTVRDAELDDAVGPELGRDGGRSRRRGGVASDAEEVDVESTNEQTKSTPSTRNRSSSIQVTVIVLPRQVRDHTVCGVTADRRLNDAIADEMLDRLARDPSLARCTTRCRSRRSADRGRPRCTSISRTPASTFPRRPAAFPFKHQRIRRRGRRSAGLSRRLSVRRPTRRDRLGVPARVPGRPLPRHAAAEPARGRGAAVEPRPFLDAGVDEFELADHFGVGTSANRRAYPVLFVRYEDLPAVARRCANSSGCPDERHRFACVRARARGSAARRVARAHRRDVRRAGGGARGAAGRRDRVST